MICALSSSIVKMKRSPIVAIEESSIDTNLWKEGVFVWLEKKTTAMEILEASEASSYRLMLDVIRILDFPDDTKPFLILLRLCERGFSDEGLRRELKGVLEGLDNKPRYSAT